MTSERVLVLLPGQEWVESWVVAVVTELREHGSDVIAARLPFLGSSAFASGLIRPFRFSGSVRAGEQDGTRREPLAVLDIAAMRWDGTAPPANTTLVVDLSGTVGYRPAHASEPAVIRPAFGPHRATSAPAGVADSMLDGTCVHQIEVLRDDGVSMFVVGRATVALDAASWTRGLNMTLWKASELIARSVRRPDPEQHAAGVVDAASTSTARVARARVRAAARLAWESATRLVSYPAWGVALQRLAADDADAIPNTANVSQLETTWLYGSHGLADPFLFPVDGSTYLFVEQFNGAGKPASIAVSRIRADGTAEAPREVLRRPYHLSYPFVFEDGGDIWLVPESCANRCITLFAAKDFPTSWEEHTVLVDRIDAVDATIHRDDTGTYWLWTAVARRGRQHHHDLWLFHSKALTGPWQPHPDNPVVDDPRYARPAGPLLEAEGCLLRPAQTGLGRYGARMVLNEILELSPEHYRERPAATIEPSWSEGLILTHTIGRAGGWQTLDGARRAHKPFPLGRAGR